MRSSEAYSTLTSQSNLDSLGISLATALTYYQAPRYHYEAKSILHDILKRKPNETAALIGIGLILEEDEDYTQAVTFLSKAIEACPEDTRLKSEIAWCKASTGDNEGALKILEECLSQPQEDDVKSQEFRAQLLYRTGVCIWELDKSANARKNRSGAYRRFLSAIKLDTNLAPAYTKLGEYYEDYAKDKRRSRQCLQRAFELSAAEVEAAERLARSFANEGDWDIVEVITLRVIESGRTRPSPGSKKKGLSWPHSALGMVQLNRQDYASSIRSFLAALRISPDDYHSYVGLGENYYNSGRYNSAAKALQHAQSLESGNPTLKADDLWYTSYMLSNVYREIGDYDQAIIGYKGVLANRAEQYGVSISLLQTYVEKAWQDIDLGYFGRAARTSRDAFSVAKSLAQHRSDSFNLWKAIGDLCSTFTWLFGHIDMLPIQELRELILSVEHLDDLNIFKEFDGVDMDSVVNGEHQTQERRRRFCIYAAILAQKRALRTVLHDFHAQAVGWYNLGWSEYRAYVCFNMILKEDMKIQKKFMKAAVRCFKKAIELEASNAQFWNALGIVTTSLDAKIAQHSFVRSLHINERNAHVWTNLGTLYLLHNDLELAHLAFARAQATDPDYAHAWVGEGFLSLGRGDIKEAWMHFTHAFEISGSSSISVKQHYGVASFDYVSQTSPTSNTTDLLQPLFALQQLHAIIPNNDPTRYIAALFHERVGEFEVASTILSEICATAEAEFESSESSTSLTRYAQAKVDLARNEFATKKYQKAIESADTALDLLNDTDNCKLSNQARRNCLLSAHLTGGLANYYLKQMDRSIAMFRSALNESNSSPEVVCLLSQVLWFKGGKDERRVATDQLLHCAEKNPSNARVITLLGAIAVLTDDEDTMAAVNEDLRSLRTQPGLSTTQLKQLLQMITILADVSSNQPNKQHIVLNEVMTNIMLSPSQPFGWTELANISDDKFPASMAVRTALREAPPKGPILAVELAKAFLATNALVDAQRACMLAPWLQEIFKKFQTPTLPRLILSKIASRQYAFEMVDSYIYSNAHTQLSLIVSIATSNLAFLSSRQAFCRGSILPPKISTFCGSNSMTPLAMLKSLRSIFRPMFIFSDIPSMGFISKAKAVSPATSCSNNL